MSDQLEYRCGRCQSVTAAKGGTVAVRSMIPEGWSVCHVLALPELTVVLCSECTNALRKFLEGKTDDVA